MIRHRGALTLAIVSLAAAMPGSPQWGSLVAPIGLASGDYSSFPGAHTRAVALCAVAKPTDAHLDLAERTSEEAKGALNG